MKESVELNPQPLPPARAFRIVIPAKVAFNMDSLLKIVNNVGEAIGCRTCFSGADCYFQLEKDFVVDPESLVVKALPAPY
jgi:hypothetical protein